MTDCSQQAHLRRRFIFEVIALTFDSYGPGGLHRQRDRYRSGQYQQKTVNS